LEIKPDDKPLKLEAQVTLENKPTTKDHIDDSKKEKPTRVDTELECAYQYYDKSRTGYLLDKDMEHLFHCLNKGFSKGYVRDLVAVVCETHKREHSKVLMYRQLVEFFE